MEQGNAEMQLMIVYANTTRKEGRKEGRKEIVTQCRLVPLFLPLVLLLNELFQMD